MEYPFEVEAGAEYLISPVPSGGEHYFWEISDHLNNTRVVFDNLAQVVERNDYYPFGLRHTDQQTQFAYTYNDKEEQRGVASGLQRYGFRFYDSSIARFTGVDPISDKFAYLSTFNYASNDPVKKIDLYGLQGVDSNIFNNFISDANENGILSAIGNYLNINSVFTGSRDKKEQSLSRMSSLRTVVAKGDKFKNDALDIVESGAQHIGAAADIMEGGAISTTALSGGASSPITIPAAGFAEVVGDVALGVEVGVDYARDGKVDQTIGDILTKIIFGSSGKLLDSGVDALEISGQHAEHNEAAIKAIGQGVNKVAEEITKKE